jgi:hypothetical protein
MTRRRVCWSQRMWVARGLRRMVSLLMLFLGWSFWRLPVGKMLICPILALYSRYCETLPRLDPNAAHYVRSLRYLGLA